MSHLKAFILLDMIGDADLTANISSNDETLNDAIGPLARRWVSSKDVKRARRRSEGHLPTWNHVDIMDDHVRLNNVGVPAVDLIDHRYGPNATGFANSYWHTLEDTPDKVSADALETVMHLVELG